MLLSSSNGIPSDPCWLHQLSRCCAVSATCWSLYRSLKHSLHSIMEPSSSKATPDAAFMPTPVHRGLGALTRPLAAPD